MVKWNELMDVVIDTSLKIKYKLGPIKLFGTILTPRHFLNYLTLWV